MPKAPKHTDTHIKIPADLYGDLKTKRDRLSNERKVKVTLRECIIDAIIKWVKN
jgi:hypothetical protein